MFGRVAARYELLTPGLRGGRGEFWRRRAEAMRMNFAGPISVRQPIR